ncbi:gastrula zinc finger protein XlCGF52.1 [Fukomys damarensis]|uniref:gastrula zinc finger protein XlCGF52.1 n=1 Tax=Fukomys damarensis TaxID=885580 RepID=UPI0008FF11CB|nr:gastrula zinc finger protein XlCGF52.1 [Fukomys damarensis]
MVSPLPAISPEPPALLLIGQVQESPVPGPWNPQAGPLELNCGEADKSLTFPDPGRAIPQPDWSCPLECGLDLYTEEVWDSTSLEQSSDSNRDRNTLHGHNLPNDCEHLEVPQKTSSEELPSVGTESVTIQMPYLVWASPSSNKLPLKPRDNQQKPNTTNSCYPQYGQQFVSNKLLPCNPQTGELGYNCHICGKGFLHWADLDAHQYSHTNERPFQFAQCSMQFTQLSHLIEHERKHLQIQSYQCPVCRQNFTLLSSLTEHRKIHSEGKKHQCLTCGNFFNRRSSLLQHQRTHTGERPYICEYCQKSYRYRSNLMIHRRNHTGEKPYKCSLCSKGFIKKTELTSHQAAHFREEFLGNNTSREKDTTGSEKS